MKKVKLYSVGNGVGGSWSIAAYSEGEALRIFKSLFLTRHYTPSGIKEIPSRHGQDGLRAIRDGEYEAIKVYAGI